MMIALALMLAVPGGPCANPNADQATISQCAADDYARADTAMNRQWKLTLAHMQQFDKDVGPPEDGRPTNAALLLDSQRAWLSFRDAQCELEGAQMRGGSAQPAIYSGCLARLTKARTAQLHELAGD